MASRAVQPRLDEVQHLLQAHGYTKKALKLDGLSDAHAASVVDALHALLVQRDEEVEVRGRLLAQNEALEASVQRAQRTAKKQKTESERVISEMSQVKAKVQCV